MSDAPERVWLQIGEPEVTWCEDKIHDTDVEYIRADIHEADANDHDKLYQQIHDSREELRAEIARLREALRDMITVAERDGWADSTTGRQLLLAGAKTALEADHE